MLPFFKSNNMKTDQHASKVIRDDYFLVGGRRIKIPTKYYQHKIGEIASKMEFEAEKLTDNEAGMQYAIMLNSKYAWEMTQIVGCILYGRNFLYNPITRPLSYIYRKIRTKILFHELSNQDIAKIFVDYVHVVGIGNFTSIMTFLGMLTIAKRD